VSGDGDQSEGGGYLVLVQVGKKQAGELAGGDLCATVAQGHMTDLVADGPQLSVSLHTEPAPRKFPLSISFLPVVH
jgi:hypothetical protein